jgi:hypothetical protein
MAWSPSERDAALSRLRSLADQAGRARPLMPTTTLRVKPSADTGENHIAR